MQRRDQAGGRAVPLTIAGVILVTGAGAYDISTGPGRVVIGVVLVGPVLVALTGRPRPTAIVALYAVAVVIASGAWNENAGSAEYWVRVVFVSLGACISVVIARARQAEFRLRDVLRERTIVADTLEAALEPIAPPAVEGWRLSPLFRPAPTAARVGGDFYDAYRVGDDGWMIVVGDVVGHGAPAAALVGLARYTLRAAATITGSIAAAVHKLDADLVESDLLAPVALACLRLSSQSDEVQILVAGTPPPLLVDDGIARECALPGPLVGAFADSAWHEVSLKVAPGGLVLLQTDGAIDVLGPNGTRFGLDRMRDALHGVGDGPTALARISTALDEFGGRQRDDVLLLAVERVVDSAAR